MIFKYMPDDFNNDGEEYLKKWLSEMYKGYENHNDVKFEIYRSHATNELKCLWKCGVISKSKADEINNYIWGLAI